MNFINCRKLDAVVVAHSVGEIPCSIAYRGNQMSIYDFDRVVLLGNRGRESEPTPGPSPRRSSH